GKGLWVLGLVSAVCGTLSYAVLPAVIGLPLGLIALALASADLGQMRRGLKDPEGVRLTRAARNLGWVGTVLSVCNPLVTGWVIAANWSGFAREPEAMAVFCALVALSPVLVPIGILRAERRDRMLEVRPQPNRVSVTDPPPPGHVGGADPPQLFPPAPSNTC